MDFDDYENDSSSVSSFEVEKLKGKGKRRVGRPRKYKGKAMTGAGATGAGFLSDLGIPIISNIAGAIGLGSTGAGATGAGATGAGFLSDLGIPIISNIAGAIGLGKNGEPVFIPHRGRTRPRAPSEMVLNEKYKRAVFRASQMPEGGVKKGGYVHRPRVYRGVGAGATGAGEYADAYMGGARHMCNCRTKGGKVKGGVRCLNCMGRNAIQVAPMGEAQAAAEAAAEEERRREEIARPEDIGIDVMEEPAIDLSPRPARNRANARRRRNAITDYDIAQMNRAEFNERMREGPRSARVYTEADEARMMNDLERMRRFGIEPVRAMRARRRNAVVIGDPEHSRALREYADRMRVGQNTARVYPETEEARMMRELKVGQTGRGRKRGGAFTGGMTRQLLGRPVGAGRRKGKGNEVEGEGFWDDFKSGFMSVVKPVAGIAKSLAPLAGPEGMALSGALGAVGLGKKKKVMKKGDGRMARAQIVKQVMNQRGVSLAEASKIVKNEGLY